MNNTSKSKEILFLSGTRADFGKLKALINGVIKSDSLNYKIFVTGMHLLNQYGNTFQEIEKSGFTRVHKYINQYIGEPMEMVLANTVHGLSRYVHQNKPDLIVIHGDRIEALAGAIVGSMNNILVAHIEGGERSGTIDELIRHSVSKLSHIHFVANNEAKQRLLQMGENCESIFVIGSPDIDVMKSSNLPCINSVKSHYAIPFETYSIVLFHPVTTELDEIKCQINNLVSALIKTNRQYIVIFPNNDPGTKTIIDAYERICDNDNFRIFPSIRFENFLTFIKHAKSVIGNSSAGIHEAPIYGVPTINIGSRQNDRFKYKSIHDCSYDIKDIISKINQIYSKQTKYTNSSYFGIGNSASSFIKLLESRSIWNVSCQKIFQDIPFYNEHTRNDFIEENQDNSEHHIEEIRYA